MGDILYLIDEETNNLYYLNFTYKQKNKGSFDVYSVKDMNIIFENFYKMKQKEEVKN